MPYVLVAWRRSDGSADPALDQAVLTALDDTGPAVPLLTGLALYPSATVGMDHIKRLVLATVNADANFELVLIRPNNGTQLEGWFEDGRPLEEARDYVNSAGRVYPRALQRTAGDG